MDRRSFLKYMGVTTAAASASKVLANIPEAEPKIELLQTKEIVTDVSTDVIFDSLISFRYVADNMVSMQETLYPNHIFKAEPFQRSLECKVTLATDTPQAFMREGMTFSFYFEQPLMKPYENIQHLMNKRFITRDIEIVGEARSYITANIIAYEIT